VKKGLFDINQYFDCFSDNFMFFFVCNFGYYLFFLYDFLADFYLNKHDIAKNPKLIVFTTRKLIRG